jgi:transaldolase
MKSPCDLRVKVFADGADRSEMVRLHSHPFVRGFTTNPTLMRKAGVQDYEDFAREILVAIPDRPICFEVIADDFEEMAQQACKIASWSERAYVKIPITNTLGVSSATLVRCLGKAGVRMNITAIFTLEQVAGIADALAGCPPAYVSIFAGRIADTGRDPVPIMAEAIRMLKPYKHVELIWASPRELFNVFQADAIGCHIITVSPDIVEKLLLVGHDLRQYSLETVQAFRDDAVKAGYVL